MERLWSKVVNFFKDIPEIIETNHSNPIFWIIVIVVFIGVFFTAVNNFGEK